MREAVVVSYARTGLAKSGRGGFNMTPAMTMAAHAISSAVAKSGVEPDAVEDVYLGNGAHGAGNLARLAGLLAGLPVTTAGATIQRHCSSGLNAIALAANYIKQDGAEVVVAGGVESISMPNPGMGGSANMDAKLAEMYPAVYMAMIETADIVAERYQVSREYQDEYSLESQKRMGAAQANGLFEDEIVPLATKMKLVDKETKAETIVDYVVDGDECNRPETTLEGLTKLKPVRGEGNYITAGNASQLSDGARGVQGLGRGRLRARRDGHRAGLRRSAPVGAARSHRRRHRPVGAQRGVRQPVPVLPRSPRHRPGQVQRQRRLNRHRPPLWHDRRAVRRPHPAGGNSPQGQVGCRHHVHRRRPGRSGALRDLLVVSGFPVRGRGWF